MKVLHSGSLNTSSGGPALSMYLTIKGLIENGVTTHALTAPIPKNGHLIGNDITIFYTDPVLEKRFAFTPNMSKTLKNIGLYDLYHIQGIWQYPGHIVSEFARKNKIPYIISLRGMLYPKSLEHSSLIKKMSLSLYQNKDLANASCIQATCHEEMEHYRNLGFKNPVAIIPNPIETYPAIEVPVPEKDKFTIGYLGRLHPRKRVERIIYALSSLKNILPPTAVVKIIGGGDLAYEEFLKNEATRLNLKDRIEFAGFLNGSDKDQAIRQLSVLVVPSDYENFGNIVTESLVRGVPVIASKGTPWQILENYECGWWIDNDQESINSTILSAFNKNRVALREMGLMGQKLVSEQFAYEILGMKMKQLYEWILGSAEKPDYVYVN